MTRAKAIAAKCKDCIYDPREPGTWRMQVTACTTTECALYPYRPLYRAANGEKPAHGETQVAE